jgi:hypothetical protein
VSYGGSSGSTKSTTTGGTLYDCQGSASALLSALQERDGSRQDQVAVAELVPEVAVLLGGLVRDVDKLVAGYRAQQLEV